MARPHPVVRIAAEFSDRTGRSEYHADIIEDIIDDQEILVIIIERYDIGSLKFRVSHRIGHRLPDRVGSSQTQVLVRVMETEDGKSMYDALVALQADGRLTFDGSESTYGFYITSDNSVAATNENYWAVYTTLGTYEGVSYSDATWGTIEHSGPPGNTCTLASASYGVSGLPLVEGELYALVWTAIES